jgi:hypothetical protein
MKCPQWICGLLVHNWLLMIKKSAVFGFDSTTATHREIPSSFPRDYGRLQFTCSPPTSAHQAPSARVPSASASTNGLLRHHQDSDMHQRGARHDLFQLPHLFQADLCSYSQKHGGVPHPLVLPSSQLSFFLSSNLELRTEQFYVM